MGRRIPEDISRACKRGFGSKIRNASETVKEAGEKVRGQNLQKTEPGTVATETLKWGFPNKEFGF